MSLKDPDDDASGTTLKPKLKSLNPEDMLAAYHGLTARGVKNVTLAAHARVRTRWKAFFALPRLRSSARSFGRFSGILRETYNLSKRGLLQ